MPVTSGLGRGWRKGQKGGIPWSKGRKLAGTAGNRQGRKPGSRNKIKRPPEFVGTVQGIETVFVDTGCEASPKCLECPLPICRYDEGGDVVFDNFMKERM